MGQDWLAKYMIPEGRVHKKYGITAVNNMRREQFSDAVINAGNAKFGYNFAKGARGMVDPNARGNWLTPYFGDRGGFGIEPYRYVKSLGHSTQAIRDALPGSGLKEGRFLHETMLADDLAAAAAKPIPPPPPAVEEPKPGTRAGHAALGNTAQGIVSPQGAAYGTGGTGEAFGRRKPKITQQQLAALMINPIT